MHCYVVKLSAAIHIALCEHEREIEIEREREKKKYVVRIVAPLG